MELELCTNANIAVHGESTNYALSEWWYEHMILIALDKSKQ